jgi:hypothetical protein
MCQKKEDSGIFTLWKKPACGADRLLFYGDMVSGLERIDALILLCEDVMEEAAICIAKNGSLSATEKEVMCYVLKKLAIKAAEFCI